MAIVLKDRFRPTMSGTDFHHHCSLLINDLNQGRLGDKVGTTPTVVLRRVLFSFRSNPSDHFCMVQAEAANVHLVIFPDSLEFFITKRGQIEQFAMFGKPGHMRILNNHDISFIFADGSSGVISFQ